MLTSLLTVAAAGYNLNMMQLAARPETLRAAISCKKMPDETPEVRSYFFERVLP